MKSLIFVFLLLFLTASVMATQEEVKIAVCGSINLTEPNCTNWWDGLNLTQNFTNQINVTVVYQVNNTHINQTINQTVIQSNHTTTENINKTYVNNYYNGTTFNMTYNRTEIDNKVSTLFPRSEFDTKLNPYSLKTDLDTLRTEVGGIDNGMSSGWKWGLVLSIGLLFIMMLVMFMGMGGE